MKHVRIITLEGDEQWIRTTLKNSLQEGVNSKMFGEGRTITVQTIEGLPLVTTETTSHKPESRFDEE